MKTHHLTTPIKNEDLEGIEIGDIVYLSGYLITSRDDVHMRLVKQHRPLPVDLAGKAIFHAGPIMVPCGEESGSGYKVVSIGPTTSMRMEKFEREFIRDTGVKIIVGKGGMGPNTEAAAATTRPFTACGRALRRSCRKQGRRSRRAPLGRARHARVDLGDACEGLRAHDRFDRHEGREPL